MKKANGFTLIELMITVAILVILLMVGVPSFLDLLGSNRITSTTNSISAGLQTARSEAIIRKTPVIFCANNGSGNGCATNINSLGDGWVVGTDDDLNGSIDTVIRVVDNFPPSMQFTLTGFTTNFVRYNTVGIAAASPTSIRICDSNRSGEKGNDILFNGTGGITVSANKPSCT